jgi:peptidoglycan/LPS O-acetylase OafA/YrhL
VRFKSFISNNQTSATIAFVCSFLAVGVVVSISREGAIDSTLTYSLVPILMGIVVAISAAQTPVTTFLRHRFLIHIGAISYSFYLWQQLFLAPPGLSGFSDFFGPLQSVLCAYFLANISFVFIEKYCRTVGRRIVNQISNSTVSTATP